MKEANEKPEMGICHISKKDLPLADLVSGNLVRNQLMRLILKDFPDFSNESRISHESLNHYRKKYLENLLKTESKALGHLEKDVIKAIHNDELLSENIDLGGEGDLNLGQRMADKIATFGGSWSFIIFFFSFILCWIAINLWVLASKPFDPFPFILLNLILSCLAAIQAPIIMMSQNRQEQKDRSRSKNDYKINLKAELEIRLLHEKIDHMIVHQNTRLLKIQELQLDYLEDLLENKKGAEKS